MCLGSSEFFEGIKFSEWMREDFIFGRKAEIQLKLILVFWIFKFNVRRLLLKTFANLTKIHVFAKVFSRQFVPLEYLVNLFHPNKAIVYE